MYNNAGKEANLANGLAQINREKKMAVRDLAQRITKHGSVTAAWFDEEEETVVVQCGSVHLSFYKQEFKSFVECLVEAMDQLRSDSAQL